ncbi:BTB/POZ domain-containing protein 2-like [Centruroides sculpturatus]|uniref:BTB/POZ domain-containing protein 2-like n=1 Tax=Centruroides sculpturatus TaxID=218467 RepID=UPI000C6DE1B6|nr:BTB/POZ domain-containing protein 2-like [Centruroides sculpturatus]
MADWQLQTNSLSGKIKQLMLTDELHDVTFLVGNDQKKFHSHKLLLSVYSDVFRSMLYDSSCKTEEILLPEVESRIFQMVLNYVYTEKLETDEFDDAIKLFYVANKYSIVELMQLSREIAIAKLSSENVCVAYDIAIQMNDDIFDNKCGNIIKMDTVKVLESQNFLRSSSKTIQKIISFDFLNIPDELFLFVAITKWVKEEIRRLNKTNCPENLRKIMDPILPHIRFLTMTHNQLFGSPARSGIIKSEEIMQIAMHLSNPEQFTDLPNWCNTEKNNRIGSVKPNTLYRLRFNQICFSSIDKIKKTEKLRIKCCIIPSWNDILLKGFTVCMKNSIKIQPQLYIASSSESYKLVEYAKIINSENDSNNPLHDIYEMRLFEPLLMKKWNYYYIKIKSDDPIVMCGESILCDKLYNLSYLGVTYLKKTNCHFQEILCFIDL